MYTNKANRKTRMKRTLTTVIGLLSLIGVQAQLSSNPDKFLGNITTSYQVDYGNVPFYQLWNQITPENETKWDAIEPSRGNFSFGNADRSANYAKLHHFPFKYHTLVWGGQYPSWMNNLSTAEQYSALIEYFDGVKKHYPDLEIIDVVNEAINESGAVHAPAPYRAALGGEGRTGYDWIIKAFQLAHERWPNAILVYNDYNTFQWNTDQFIRLVQALRDSGAPIDAYGCQSHDLTDISLNNFQNAMNKLQNALQMPMYSTEFDIGTSDDQKQLNQYKNLIPVLWEADYCAGITLWGYIYGHTWTTDGNSGLIRDGKDRPAMTWLREYMQTDAAKNAKSPFPGFKKEASIYVKPASMKVAKDDILSVWIDATLATKTIDKVELYYENELVATMTEAPYIAEVTPSIAGTNKELKAVVTATDGSQYERISRVSVSRAAKRKPYNDVVAELPGVIDAMNYDEGGSGISFNNAARSGATKTGGWMEYTVDVNEPGLYSLEVEVASTQSDGMFHLVDNHYGDMIFLTNFFTVPNTGSTTEYQTLRCPMLEPLTEGRHVFCLNIDKGGFRIKNMTFKLLPTIDLPGVLEIEDFAKSSSGVNIISGNGGSVLGNTAKNEWLEYSVNFTQAGKYSYDATFSSTAVSSFSMVLIEADGTEKTLANVTLPKTNSLDSYQVKTGKIRNAIKAGKQTLRITVTGGTFNFDKMEFTCIEPSGITELTDDDTATGNTYNISGQKVDDNYRGIVIRNGKKVIKR